ncbi:PopZ family protein [Mesorhizobium sp. M0488]|uniref:PopZ family protein n=1 Tax=unclassified Mesorhizobium TaxID=325217 RepID=UPI00333598D0
MATASSAQREPSMEEILASIRRIIEDSDTGRKPPADELRQDLEPASSTAPAADFDAFRADLHAPEVRKPVATVEPPAAEPVIARMEAAPARPSMTLAEVSARIAADPAPAAGIDPSAAPDSAATSEEIVADWRREIAAVGEQAKAIPGIRKPVAQPEASVHEPVTEPAFERPSSGDDLGRPAASDAPAVRPAILSEHTGRQVAAAFGELSDAFASRGKKTFDEMAEEMLRPMLQDWLDNNLPTLVERLVREEIERVARGAQ